MPEPLTTAPEGSKADHRHPREVKGRSRLQSTLGFLTRVAISLTLIVWLLSRVGVGEIVARWKGVNLWILFLVVPAIHLVAVGIRAWRLKTILAGVGLDRPLWWLGLTQLEGAFFASFLPGGIGGDIYRTYRIARATEDSPRSVVSVVIERLIGSASMLIVSMASLAYGLVFLRHPVFEQLSGTLIIVLIAFIVSSGLLWAVLKGGFVSRWLAERLPSRFRTILTRVSLPQIKSEMLIRVALLSVLLQLAIVVWYIAVSRSLGIDVPLWNLMLTVPLVELLVMLPISVGGIGVREVAFAALLGPFGVAAEDAISFSLLAFMLATMIRVLSGTPLLWRFVWKRDNLPGRPAGNEGSPAD